MTQTTPPLYGRFDFGEDMTLAILIQRLKQISNTFLDQANFNSYLKEKEGKTFYGLDYDELAEVFQQLAGDVSILNASASTPDGKGVSINIRFRPNTNHGSGQFMVASGSTQINEEIEEMIHGEWTPRPEPVYEPINLLDLLQGIASARQTFEDTEAKKNEKAQVISLRESFYFDKRVSIDKILDLLDEISVIFLQGAPFNIRLETIQGDYIVDMRREEVVDFFSRQKQKIRTLFVDAGTSAGHLIDMKLMFRPPNVPPTVELEIVAIEGDEIAELISDTLAKENIPESPQKLELYTETFNFHEQFFSLEDLIELVRTISTSYLPKAEPHAVITSKSRESYGRLNLYELQEAYDRRMGKVNSITVSMSQAETHQSFSITFQFRHDWREPSGAMTFMLGEVSLYKELRKFVWDSMRLSPAIKLIAPYIKKPQTSENELVINPIFDARKFEKITSSCLICMPLEAYWSETLWEHIKSTLSGIGYSSVRSNSIFSPESLEGAWKSMNEVDILIADMTYKNPDVFYKIGVAHTLGKPVAILTQHERDIPADFKNFPHLIYNNDVTGLIKMADELKELIRAL